MNMIALAILVAASFAATIANERRVMRQREAAALQREEQARAEGYHAGTRDTILRAARRRPIVGRGLSALITRS